MSRSIQRWAIDLGLVCAGLGITGSGAMAHAAPFQSDQPSEDRDRAHHADHSAHERAEAAADRDERAWDRSEDVESQEDAASEEETEPGHRGGRSRAPGVVSPGIGPTPEFRENFEIIYRLRLRQGEQRGEIFNLSVELARLTRRPPPTQRPAADPIETSSPGTVAAQRAELASLLPIVQRNDALIKQLREAIVRKQHERNR